jgi:hypothetical protein
MRSASDHCALIGDRPEAFEDGSARHSLRTLQESSRVALLLHRLWCFSGTTVCATVGLVENATFAKLVRAADTNWPVLAEDDYSGMTATTEGTALEFFHRRIGLLCVNRERLRRLGNNSLVRLACSTPRLFSLHVGPHAGAQFGEQLGNSSTPLGTYGGPGWT